MQAAQLPESSSLSSAGRQLDKQSTLADAGIGAESVLQEIPSIFEFEKRTNGWITFYSPRHITLFAKSVTMGSMTDKRFGYAIVKGQSAPVTKIKFKILSFDPRRTMSLIGIQPIYHGDQSEWNCVMSNRPRVGFFNKQRDDDPISSHWEQGDEVEIAVYCDEENVAEVTISKNGDAPFSERPIGTIKKDDWEFFVNVQTKGYYDTGHIDPITLQIID